MNTRVLRANTPQAHTITMEAAAAQARDTVVSRTATKANDE